MASVGAETQARHAAYDNLALTLGVRDLEWAGMLLGASLHFDNVLDRDNLRPNVRGGDPRAFIQNHFNVMARLRLAL
jgi:hypothetical protein